MTKQTTRKKRKPAEEELIYTSVTGRKIRTAQYINELLAFGRARHLGISTDKPWSHPEIQEYYNTQWGDIDNAIRRYGGRNVVLAVERLDWLTNPKYGDFPFRMQKFMEIMKSDLGLLSEDVQQETKSYPTNYEPLDTRPRRDF